MCNDYEIFGLAYDCSLQKRKQDCPFMEIEHLTFKEKVVWINDKSKKNKESIMEHHFFCNRQRVTEINLNSQSKKNTNNQKFKKHEII